MDKALTLIALQKDALQAQSLEECVFQITNKTHQLVKYDQAIFFENSHGIFKAKTVSGNATIDPKGSHTSIIERIIKSRLSQQISNESASAIIVIDPANDIAGADQDSWKNFAATHNLLIPFKTPLEKDLGALLLQREKKFDEAEQAILEELASAYSHALALQHLRQKQKMRSIFIFGGWTRRKKWAAVLILLLFFLPVRLSVSAPAEIVAEKSKIVSAPFEGMIDNVLVKPGDSVQEGQILLRMDEDALKSRAQSAAQALELARVSLSRVRREALANPEKKAELNKLQAEIKAREIEYKYANTLLEKSAITSPQKGVAVFPSTNALRGKPVVSGERLVQIADPQSKELLIRVPAEAMMDFDQNAQVKFYSGISPLSSYEGHVLSIGYQASADPDGLLTYKVRAAIPDHENLRIGWKGTAKIYDEWSILGYAILRRPLIALRNITGL
ncbi:MAG: efflux RND transporter periplasmic adaptor subunit [Alphaproteobacteria bacterium]